MQISRWEEEKNTTKTTATTTWQTHTSTSILLFKIINTMYVVVDDTTKNLNGRRWWWAVTQNETISKIDFLEWKPCALCHAIAVDTHPYVKPNKKCIFYRSLSHIRHWTLDLAIKQFPVSERHMGRMGHTENDQQRQTSLFFSQIIIIMLLNEFNENETRCNHIN